MTDSGAIVQFVAGLLEARGLPGAPGPQESLFLSGRLDSMAAMKLLMFLEAEFGFRMSGSELSLARLDTIEKIIGEVSAG